MVSEIDTHVQRDAEMLFLDLFQDRECNSTQMAIRRFDSVPGSYPFRVFDYDQLLSNLGRRVTLTPEEAPATVLDATGSTPLFGAEPTSDDDLQLLDLGA